ncbi:MAG TPA: response regulator transcription factor [Terriglobia bacterium]|nr:response regulator transcription factor [Terriglobia bacterium]
MDKIRILLLDDHALFREGLSRLVDSEPDLEMTGHCATVDRAIDILRQKSIDLVLLDYDLGKENGFQFIARAREMGFEGRFLIVTAGMSDAQSVQAVRLGVGGIFTKHSSPVSLAQAIRKVMAGETWLDQSSVQALVEATKRQEAPDSRRPFTERENQVLQGVFEGFSNKEIGARLDISESSVKAALQQLFHKTGVRTRSQLVRIALEEGFGRRK